MGLENISKLISEVSIRRKTFDQFKKKYGSLLAPDFFVMDYLHNYETGLSSILAELLNPKGSHAQGTLFIESFLNVIGLDDNWKDGVENVELKSEVSTDYGRPDIVIEYKDGRVIIIENKPWASDQKDQLQRYTGYGEAQYKNWVLIYISNNEPTSIENDKRESLEKDRKFKQIRYDKEIVSWLEQTSSKVKPLHLRVFLEEICRWIDKNINGSVPMEESREIVEAITKDPDSLKSAFYIYKTFPEVQDYLISKLNKELPKRLEKKRLEEEGYGFTIEGEFSREKYSCIYIDITPKEDRDAKLYVCFSFEGKDYKNLIWGISLRGKLFEKFSNDAQQDTKAEEIKEVNKKDIWHEVKNIMDKEFSSGKSSDWWPWYDNVEPWIDIFEGRLSEKIIELSKRVKEVFESKNKLDLFYSLKYD
jgi:hypothetical protein